MIKKTFDGDLYNKYKGNLKAYGGQSSVTADGGELVPSPLANYIKEMLFNANFIRGITPTINLKSATLKLPIETGVPSAYVVGEGANIRSESGIDGSSDLLSKSTLSNIEFSVDKIGALVGWTTEIEEDSEIDIGRFVVDRGVMSLANSEESMAILGDSTGAIVSYQAGQPEILVDGIIHQVPHSDNSTNGGLWTPVNTDYDNIIAGGSDVLTLNEVIKAQAIVNKNGKQQLKADTLVVPSMVYARMLHPVEFEPFSTLDKIGNSASVIAGHVGNIYGMNVIVSDNLPQGGVTSPATMTGNFVTSDSDTVVLALNSKDYARFVMRRELELRSEHDFNTDSEKTRMLERIGWKSYRPELVSMIHNVKNVSGA